jgi:hypothetical protein
VALIHVHSTDAQLPRTVNAPHDGFWSYDLHDGSYLLIVRVPHAATARIHFTNHAPAAHVLPSVRSSTPVAAPTIASVLAHAKAAVVTTTDVLNALQAMQPWEPMLDPDSA